MRPLYKPLHPEWEACSAGSQIPHQQVYQLMIDTLGEYCSYCEMRLGPLMITHHKLSKAWPETIYKEDWDHLLLICNDCRHHITKETLDPEELDDHLWPDVDPTFSLHSSSPLKYVSRTVPYTIVHEGKEISTEEQPFVFVEVNPEADKNLQRKAANTLELFQLNSKHHHAPTDRIIIPQTDHMRMMDNRLQQRTMAWQEAEAAAERLKQFKEHPEAQANPGFIDLFLNQVSHTSTAKGNWSVWMTVFWQEFSDRELLENTFIERKRFNPRVHFSGTHEERIQWA